MLNSYTRKLIMVLVVFCGLAGVIKSFDYTFRNGGIDLRMRVVGARVMATGQSPYFHKWRPEESPRLLDPVDKRSRLVNGNVVTPATMIVMLPMMGLEYPTIRVLWLVLQLVAVALLLFFSLKKYGGGDKLVPIGMVVAGVLCTDTWFYHVERGQMYIFYAAFFALIYFVYKSDFKHHVILSGILAGLFLFFRPFAGILVVPFFLAGDRKWVMGWLLGVVVAILIFILPDPHVWTDYLHAMQEYTKEALVIAAPVLNQVEPIKPDIIEGATNLTRYDEFYLDHLHGLFFYFWLRGIPYNSIYAAILYAVVLGILSFLFYRNHAAREDTNKKFLFAFLLFILAELIWINPREVYNFVLWTFPIVLMVRQFQNRSALLILTGFFLLLLHHFPFPFPFQNLLCEAGLLMLLAYAIFWDKTAEITRTRA